MEDCEEEFEVEVKQMVKNMFESVAEKKLDFYLAISVDEGGRRSEQRHDKKKLLSMYFTNISVTIICLFKLNLKWISCLSLNKHVCCSPPCKKKCTSNVTIKPIHAAYCSSQYQYEKKLSCFFRVYFFYS